jgi:hypothetical protein
MAVESSNTARPLTELPQNNELNVSANYIVKLDPRCLAAFDPKVQSAIVRLHSRREYVSLDDILDEIKNWSEIERLWYLDFLYQQQSGYIDQAIVCEPQYIVDTRTGKLRVDFRLSLRDPMMPVLPPIRYFVELDSRQWHDRTPQEFAKGRRRIRVLQRKGGRAYPFAGSDVWNDASACVFEVVGAMEADLIERRRLIRLAIFAASRRARL